MSGKKVVIISSSFRKNGNSDLLCQQFAKGAREANHKVIEISLAGKTINPCYGCGVCQKNDTGCFQKDDVRAILDEIQDGDVLVFGTPIYFYGISGQLKTFLDRTYAAYRHWQHLDVYALVSFAGDEAKYGDLVQESFEKYVDCLNTNVVLKQVILAYDCMNKGEVKTKPAYLQAYEAGKEC